jgi:hypothetical protein
MVLLMGWLLGWGWRLADSDFALSPHCFARDQVLLVGKRTRQNPGLPEDRETFEIYRPNTPCR